MPNQEDDRQDPGLISQIAPKFVPERLCVVIAGGEPLEDSAVNRFLAPRGHRVLVAGSRNEALALLEREPVDLVLVDMDTPSLDGYALAGEISGRGLHLAAMTEDVEKNSRPACLAAGLQGYLHKPFLADALLDEIERLYKPAPTPAA